MVASPPFAVLSGQAAGEISGVCRWSLKEKKKRLCSPWRFLLSGQVALRPSPRRHWWWRKAGWPSAASLSVVAREREEEGEEEEGEGQWPENTDYIFSKSNAQRDANVAVMQARGEEVFKPFRTILQCTYILFCKYKCCSVTVFFHLLLLQL